MLPEIRIRPDLPDELSAFIHVNYQAKPADIEKNITEAIGKEKRYDNASRYLMVKAKVEAQDVGVGRLPAVLAALQQLEVDIPDEKKLLTPQKFVDFLASAEMTTARKNKENLNLPKEAKTHLEKALKLLEFLEKMQ